jgi:hypothetical protein
MRPTIIFTATTLLVGLVAVSSASQADVFSYTFTDVNVPGSMPNSTGVFGFGLNNWGQVAGSYVNSEGQYQGFLYTGGKYLPINVPGSTNTTPTGINDWGQTVGYYCCSNGIAPDFLYDHGKFIDFSNVNVFQPTAINVRGQILGFNPATGNYAIETRGVFTTLTGAPGATHTFFSDFNNFGQFVGFYVDSGGNGHGFLDTKGVFTPLAEPAGNFTTPLGINDSGQIVGTYTDSAGNGHGFIDTHGHFTTFDEPNAALGPGTQPLAINDLGQIFGWYYDANFNIYAFLATPNIFPIASLAADPPAAVPEASTWAMMLMGFAGLSLAAFRKRPRKTASTIS